MSIVLIADDHLEVRRALRWLLESKCGVTCVEAEDGVDAIAKAAEFEPDVVVLDFLMPEMHGLEAARLLKEANPNVPIFLLTSYHEREVEAAAYSAGISRVFSKAGDLNNFVGFLNEILILNRQE